MPSSVCGPLALAVLLAVSVSVHATPGAPLQGKDGQDTPEAAPFYREWTMAELLPSVMDLDVGRNWAQGRDLFRQAACGACHAFGSESQGAGLAPDLTAVGTTYSRDFVLQSILEPSAEINGRFFHTTFTLKNGIRITGSVVDVVDKTIFVAPVMLVPDATIEIAESDVASEVPSAVSPMPAGLINSFTKEQVIELLAFLDAGGDPNAAIYRKK